MNFEILNVFNIPEYGISHTKKVGEGLARKNGRFVRLICRAKKPLGDGAPAYGCRQSTSVQL
jgi:hypothetical protein